MWIIFNKLIPVKGFWMMTLWFMIFVREDTTHGRNIPERIYRHERRHWHQVLQIMITSFALFLATWLIYDYNPWWWLLWAASYYAVYVACWLIEILLPPYNMAYKNICFETECQYTQDDPDYSRHFWNHWFGWFKYISNKKYPPKR